MCLAKSLSTLILWRLAYANPIYQALQPTARHTNDTIPSQNAFMREPSTRGTIGLIYSCLKTLFFCAWTAVHLNVPPSGSLIKSTTHRLTWMMLAAFLPEFVIWRALRQWTAARHLLKIVNTMGPSAAAGMQLVCDLLTRCTLLIKPPRSIQIHSALNKTLAENTCLEYLRGT